MIPHSRPVPITPLPAKPEDVGCVCGKYQPKVYACPECLLVAIAAADS